MLTEDEIDELCTAISMKPGHRKRFPALLARATDEMEQENKIQKKRRQDQAEREEKIQQDAATIFILNCNGYQHQYQNWYHQYHSFLDSNFLLTRH